jgi:hypothetical protein
VLGTVASTARVGRTRPLRSRRKPLSSISTIWRTWPRSPSPPGRAGPVAVAIRVSREDSANFAVKEARLTLDPPNAAGKSIERAAICRPDRTWQVDRIDIEQAGIWTVRVIVVPASGPPLVLDAPIVIER